MFLRVEILFFLSVLSRGRWGEGRISKLFLNLDIVVSLEPSWQRTWINTPYLFSVEGSQLVFLPK